MTSIHALPTELTDSILEQVSARDLVALSLTSQKLRAAATPLLYSQIHFHIDRNNPRPLIHLCRSIFQNPKLAVLVKSVRLRDSEPKIQRLYQNPTNHHFWTPKASPPQPLDRDGLSQFVSFITGTGLSYASLWVEKLRIGDLNAYVALLLSQLPSLVSFHVGYAVVLADLTGLKDDAKRPEITGENQFLGKMFQSAAFDANHGMSTFQHLQDVSYPGPLEANPGRNPDLSNLRDVMALLSLPSLRSLSGWCLNPISFPFTWPGPAGPPNLSHLTSLAMSFVHVEFFAQIIAQTTNLKKLSWEWKYMEEIDPLNTNTIDLGRFLEAIIPCKDTLEDLTINCVNTISYYDHGPRGIFVRGNLHGLSQFANIKRFKAPFAVLLPDWDEIEPLESTRIEDSMPPNVEIVTITDENGNEDSSYTPDIELARLRSWVTETAATRTPKLVEICIYLCLDSDYDHLELHDDIHRVFEGSELRHRIARMNDDEPWNDV